MPSPKNPFDNLSARAMLASSMRRLRMTYEWSQEELAARSGLDRSFIAHVERGARNIAIDNIEKLAKALDVNVADLFSAPALTDKQADGIPDTVKRTQ